MSSDRRTERLRVDVPTLEPDPAFLGMLAHLSASSVPAPPRTARSSGLRLVVAMASVAVIAAATWAAGIPTGKEIPLSPADAPTQVDPTGTPSPGDVGTPHSDVSTPGSPLSPGLPGIPRSSSSSSSSDDRTSDPTTDPDPAADEPGSTPTGPGQHGKGKGNGNGKAKGHEKGKGPGQGNGKGNGKGQGRDPERPPGKAEGKAKGKAKGKGHAERDERGERPIGR
ncbi:hypothetical protein ACFJIY_04025 [Pimelobacter simplex]|uniref:hypothetical protein n=1 Tax=Nocardioides simplex TaxID=2045 RepID=UPI0036730F97